MLEMLSRNGVRSSATAIRTQRGPGARRSLLSAVAALAFQLFAGSPGTAQAQPCVDEFGVGVDCTSAGQLCDPAVVRAVATTGLLTFQYTTSPTHCSSVGVIVSLDGAPVYESGVLGPGVSTGEINLGPVAPGPHTITVNGVGYEGGCNNGSLGSWGGTIRIVTESVPPTIESSPVSVSACAFGAATFSVTVAGTGPLTYQWTKDAAPIDTVANPSAATPSLVISPAQTSDEGGYACVVSNPCGFVTSDTATLTINERCSIADVCGIGGPGVVPCGDGLITGDDFNAFINAFVAGDSLADIVSIGGEPPPDGLITGDDFNAFINAFALGCP